MFQKSIILRLLAFAFFSFSIGRCAQGQFELYETEITLNSTQPFLGSGISLADFDRDGWDDFTVPNTSIGVDAYRNAGDGTFELYYTFSITDEVNEALWIDYDNDYDSDLFCAVRNGPNRLFRNDGLGIFTDVSIQIRPIGANSDSQGCTWGDYNRDGFLDLYVSNRDYQVQENWLFHNDGDGTFTEVTTDIGLNYGLGETLQSTWCDINMDGWQDLFISEDHSQLTKLFVNDQGYFTEIGYQTGAGLSMDAMSNTIGDFDRDGDFDIYVTNNAEGNALLQNTNGIFTNVADLFGVAVYDCCWSGIWMDYDLDGDDDLYVAEEEFFAVDRQNNLFENPGSGPFIPVNGGGLVGDTFSTFGAGKFDFNNDFLWDFATFNIDPVSISVWRNTNQPGNAIKMGFIGTVSNADGIGAIVHAYHNGELHMLQTYCGENFLTQESSYEMIGLGSDTLVDSLIVTWPSGWQDHYFNLPANAFYMFTEGETFQNEISAIGPSKICQNGGHVYLDAGEYVSYNWSTGESSQEIMVNDTGLVSVGVINDFGFQATAIFEVAYFDEMAVDVELSQPACTGYANGIIEILNNEDFEQITWGESEIDSLLINLSAGEYALQLTDTNGCVTAASVEITDPPMLELSLQADSILCYGGTTPITAVVAGGTGTIDLIWNTDSPENAVAGNYTCIALDALNCSVQSSIELVEPEPIAIINLTDTACYNGTVAGEIDISGGHPEYDVQWSVDNSLALPEGNYEVVITDANNCTSSFEIDVVEYDEIGVIVESTDPFNGENGNISLAVIGGNMPLQFDWNNGSTGNPLTGIGQGNFQCTITDAMGCVFETEIISLIDALVPEIDLLSAIYPNPFEDEIFFGTDLGFCVVRDVAGKIVFEGNVYSAFRLDTTLWSSGVYTLQSAHHGRMKLIRE